MIDTTFAFDHGKHAYTAGDLEMASVTSVLKAVRLYSDYKFLDRRYRQRGTAVHQGCALVESGEYDEDSTHEEIRPYVLRYQEFVAETGFKGIAWELGMINSVMGVGGTLDVIGKIGDELTLIDVKSGECPKFVGVQLAAYEHLFMTGKLIPSPNLDESQLTALARIRRDKPKIRRRSLQLTPEKYHCRPHDDPGSMAIWINAASMYNVWRKHDLL